MRISLKNVDKTKRDKAVLKGVTLEIEEGELFVLMGRSGAGKTTFLRLISGLDAPDSGTITLGDSVVSGKGRFVEPWSRNVGFIFQELALWPHLTVGQNCEIVLKELIKSKIDRRAKVHEILNKLSIEAYADHYPHSLSAGEKQRVAIARALVGNPQILLLDEPLNFLDLHLKREIVELIKQVREASRMTVVYVTHLPDEVRLLEGNCGVLENGRIIRTGSAAETIDYFLQAPAGGDMDAGRL